MWKQYVNASSIDEVVNVLSQKKASARVVAGATDLILEMERGVRKGIETLVDISRIPGLVRSLQRLTHQIVESGFGAFGIVLGYVYADSLAKVFFDLHIDLDLQIPGYSPGKIGVPEGHLGAQ